MTHYFAIVHAKKPFLPYLFSNFILLLLLAGCDNQPKQKTDDDFSNAGNVSILISPETTRALEQQQTNILDLRYIKQPTISVAEDSASPDNIIDSETSAQYAVDAGDTDVAPQIDGQQAHITSQGEDIAPLNDEAGDNANPNNPLEYNEYFADDGVPTDETIAEDNPAESSHLQSLANSEIEHQDSTLLRKRYKQRFNRLYKTIAIVIDDIGIDQRQSKQATQLHGVYTLSFLTYGENLPMLVQTAIHNGHEIFLHQGAEPVAKLDPGPDALKVGMDAVTIRQIINTSWQKLPMAVGLNNHMGSKFTQWENGMDILVEETYSKDMIFLDSFTHKASQGLYLAQEKNYPAVARDVFIDGKKDLAWIEQQLDITKRIAVRDGFAVAIAHPYPQTLQTLPEWQKTLIDEGFRFVTISQLWRNLQPQTIEPNRLSQTLSNSSLSRNE